MRVLASRSKFATLLGKPVQRSMPLSFSRAFASSPTFERPTRASQLARLSSDEFDVVVVGGGCTGAGMALDAATRGLRVALIERDGKFEVNE